MVVQGKVRRMGAAFVIACVVAFVLFVVKSAEAQHIPSLCEGLDWTDPMYWARQCWMYAAFAPLPQLMFLVR